MISRAQVLTRTSKATIANNLLHTLYLPRFSRNSQSTMNRDSKGTPSIPPSSSPSSSSDSLSEAAKKNRSQLGDPVSLKSETSDSQPTKDDISTERKNDKTSNGKKETLAEKAIKNPTALGDPVSLKAEQSKRIPTEEEKGAKSKL